MPTPRFANTRTMMRAAPGLHWRTISATSMRIVRGLGADFAAPPGAGHQGGSGSRKFQGEKPRPEAYGRYRLPRTGAASGRVFMSTLRDMREHPQVPDAKPLAVSTKAVPGTPAPRCSSHSGLAGWWPTFRKILPVPARYDGRPGLCVCREGWVGKMGIRERSSASTPILRPRCRAEMFPRRYAAWVVDHRASIRKHWTREARRSTTLLEKDPAMGPAGEGRERGSSATFVIPGGQAAPLTRSGMLRILELRDPLPQAATRRGVRLSRQFHSIRTGQWRQCLWAILEKAGRKAWIARRARQQH